MIILAMIISYFSGSALMEIPLGITHASLVVWKEAKIDFNLAGSVLYVISCWIY